MDVQSNVTFREVQSASKWIWSIALIYVFCIWATSGLNKAEVIGSLIVMTSVLGLFAVLLLVTKQITEVRNDGIYIKRIPWQRSYRAIQFGDIAHVEARAYGVLFEYYGWVFRTRVYHVIGNRGVQLLLWDGKHIIIGSQRPDELADAIRLAKGP